MVQVIELFVISNPSDKMIVADQTRSPVLEFALLPALPTCSSMKARLGSANNQTARIGDTPG